MAALSLFMDKREFPAEFKTLDESEPGTFEGIAAVFGNVDRQGDVILPGAFKKTLRTFIKRGFLANAHDWVEPIGTIDAAEETDKGLLVRGTFHSTEAAQRARQVARERRERGKEIAMSIGFQTVKDDVVDNVRQLKELELFEVSLVTVPANPEAHVMGVKSESGTITIWPAPEDEEEIEARRTEMRRIQLTRLAYSSRLRQGD